MTFTFDCLQLGDKVKALCWLEKAFEHHTRDLFYLKVEPAYGPLRDDPGFHSLLRRMNFPEYDVALTCLRVASAKLSL